MSGERLVLLTGTDTGQSIPITDQVQIGRGPDNTLALDDPQVSRNHATVTLKNGIALLRDLDSGNGTYVADRRIIEYRLQHNDIIYLGQQQLRFEQEVSEKHDTSGVRFQSNKDESYQSNDAASMYQTFFQAPKEDSDTDALQQTERRLQAVYAANQIMASEQDLQKLFDRVMEQVFALVAAHNGVILLRDKTSGELIGEFIRSESDSEVTVSSTIVDRAFTKSEAVITVNAADDSRFESGMSIITQNISSAMCVPLLHQDEILGVIYVDNRGTTNAFVQSDLELLVALAGPAAIAIKNAQHVESLRQAYQDTLIVLANAIELRDHYTVGHTWRVTNFSIEVCKELGWSPEKLKEVQMGGVLHDVGKIAVDDAVLRKPDKLTDEEYEKIKVHPERGAQLLQDVEFLHPLIPYCLYHHERYDGKGYPYGLKGEEIPIEGRAVAVADTFDALTSNRPYRKGFDPEKAMSIIREGKGTQFDPVCVDALVRAYEKGNIDRILQDYYKKDEKSIACPFCSTFMRLPEGAEVGDSMQCEVCHRHVGLQFQNDAYYGRLIPKSTLRIPHPSSIISEADSP